jgi:eukaryotic-like serine/threonine-protein kinase
VLPTDSPGTTGGRTVGRYVLHEPIAAGGMAIVHLGRLLGQVGFARTVAIKRVHPNLAYDRDFVRMFVDEAHLAGRIHHPNVVATLDVVVDGAEVLLVMEYVHGESLNRLLHLSKGAPLPLAVGSAIVTGVLHGLHAAHEARNEQGELLGVVHRDVSPQNVIVGADGVTRVLDFGVAKASGRLHTTREGRIKGKLAYMAPEQLRGEAVTCRADVYSAAVLAWEIVTGKRLFHSDSEGATVSAVLQKTVVPPSTYAPNLPPSLDALILRGLDHDPARRFGTAREMALALERCVPPALGSEVAATVERLAGETLKKRALAIATMESAEAKTGVRLVGQELEALARPPEGATESQLSIQSAPDTRREPVRISLRQAILIGAVVVSIPAAAFVVVRASPAPKPLVLAPLSDAPAPPVAASSETAAAPTSPAMADAPAVDPTASATPPHDAAPAKARTFPQGRGTHSGARSTSGVRCDPPFTVDSIGRRVYRRECF